MADHHNIGASVVGQSGMGREPNRLELEFKSICWNRKRLVNLQVA